MEGLFLLAALVAAQADGGVAEVEVPTVLVRRLDANPAAADLVGGLSALMAERVKSAPVSLKVYSQADLERAVSIERQQQLTGCDDTSCLMELSDALGARYTVYGRIDRFGDRYLVIGSLFDSRTQKLVVQARREATDPGKLPGALDEIADDLLVPLGVARRTDEKNRLDTTGFTFGLKFSTQLVTALARFSIGGDLEIGYRITPGIHAFFQLSFVTTFADATFGATQLVPGILGARYFFRSGKSFQPYIGGGLGLLVTIRSFTDSNTRPSLYAHGGVSYLFFPWLGVTTDFSIDVLGAAFALFNDPAQKGVNLSLSLGALFRF